ncbi:hypothetical protein [Candidatus Phytoplasma tritici]|uniref:hypothetical protein n=1 Tax=Candidatus Phytoplasma tritici TaxID=321961 RepID=UPI0003FD80C5|nr:hypothetical protein [Candidatus Phytoplasma tritici]
MTRNYISYYSIKKSFRRNKLTLGSFLQYLVLPTLGIVIPFIIYFASKGYWSLAK